MHNVSFKFNNNDGENTSSYVHISVQQISRSPVHEQDTHFDRRVLKA